MSFNTLRFLGISMILATSLGATACSDDKKTETPSGTGGASDSGAGGASDAATGGKGGGGGSTGGSAGAGGSGGGGGTKTDAGTGGTDAATPMMDAGDAAPVDSGTD